MYRQASVVKVLLGVCLVAVVAYSIYLFEVHVMYPSWIKSSALTEEIEDLKSKGIHAEFGDDSNLTNGRNQIDKTIKPILQSKMAGISFPLDSEYDTFDMDVLFKKLVVVTAFTADQTNDALQMIASVQKYMPDTRIIIYNLGIKGKLLKDIGRLCNVQVRHFSFESHPRHVRNLKIFAWRPIIIQESINEFGVIFWADPNLRFKESIKALFPHLHTHHGTMFHVHGFDPKTASTTRHVYYETNHRMFNYFEVSINQYYTAKNSSPHIANGRMLFVNNSVIQEKLLQPLTRCALNDKCISPKGSSKTNHKFDTSAMAIIVYKNLLHEWTPEKDTTKFFDEVVDIRYSKKVVKEETPNYCQ